VLAADGGPARGASTLTQQLAKNLYLWPGKSYLRKGLEAWLSVWLELLWPKQRILHTYLNVVEFAPGVYGAGAASRALFHRPADALSARQAATLAAVLPNPRRMSAARPSAYVQRRAQEIEQSVEQLGGTAYLSKI
jgi:monofunctional biosynthetic peptidoglycan transglycosylase